jgi:hypothetical protein
MQAGVDKTIANDPERGGVDDLLEKGPWENLLC